MCGHMRTFNLKDRLFRKVEILKEGKGRRNRREGGNEGYMKRER